VKEHSGATAGSSVQPDSRVFDLWAQVYDIRSNPLLMLEERCATPLLPPLHGADVLDVRCGTGRWLTKLEALNPASLTGTDSSATMLERARAKVHSATKLEHRECSTLSGEDSSKTFVLASFVLSYLSDLHGFATECARILRPDGWVLISDMHPVTAEKRGWTRSFRVEGEKFEIEVHSRSLEEIVSVFQGYGFDLTVLIEPPFEAPERSAFEDAGRLADFEELDGVAAIYILKLQKQKPRLPITTARLTSTLQLTNARIASGPADRRRARCINPGKHRSLGADTRSRWLCPSPRSDQCARSSRVWTVSKTRSPSRHTVLSQLSPVGRRNSSGPRRNHRAVQTDSEDNPPMVGSNSQSALWRHNRVPSQSSVSRSDSSRLSCTSSLALWLVPLARIGSTSGRDISRHSARPTIHPPRGRGYR
jgi:ubiquinone/menaquinone biosynthesis C-methylase UbiE